MLESPDLSCSCGKCKTHFSKSLQEFEAVIFLFSQMLKLDVVKMYTNDSKMNCLSVTIMVRNITMRLFCQKIHNAVVSSGNTLQSQNLAALSLLSVHWKAWRKQCWRPYNNQTHSDTHSNENKVDFRCWSLVIFLLCSSVRWVGAAAVAVAVFLSQWSME